ncbi:pyridoxamine 5'-phosphate oxidase family protein [Nocardiopsis sp. HNM0947]|uniref:Pyridoxamine 5'-phosphate oxidase family protein n=1 Tax=Nocardiopsis coralli TaxID=2772213 RepID=A0ABR9P9T7_9ACTN|nr:pyridoxamine 5'-phosphate oxidase family protein [Nocardiopsis coralli]MBE3000603.1 pyridoxamine 5'-phosphate oxidase family protein [Nocardiopsis coralli]
MIDVDVSGLRAVKDHTQLRELVGEPAPVVVAKDRGYLDEHGLAFLERSPFVLLATSGADGTCDVSPRGEEPGVFRALDAHTVAIPDRPGNRRVDSLVNIVDNPRVGLLFCVPGTEETLRVNGTATIVVDEELRESFAVRGRAPKLVLVVRVEEAFFHCAKAFRRSSLWDPATWPDRSELPTLGQVLKDLEKSPEPVEAIDAALEAENRAALY